VAPRRPDPGGSGLRDRDSGRPARGRIPGRGAPGPRWGLGHRQPAPAGGRDPEPCGVRPADHGAPELKVAQSPRLRTPAGSAGAEMRTISAVFWNRLKVDMPLQADPTVQYAAGKERRALTRADLQLDHPYNTYRRSGLPPGPIASPGLAAVAAALDPAPVKYLYFVAIDEHRHFF